MPDYDGMNIAAKPSILSSLAALLLLPASLLLVASHLLRVVLTNVVSTVATTFGGSQRPKSSPRKVLITGASTPTGLSTARLLHSAGHTVVAADYEPLSYTSCARASVAVSRFYALSPIGSVLRASINASETDYFSSNVLHIAEFEDPDLWIHCGTDRQYPTAEVIAQAKEIVEREKHCRVLHPDTATLKLLTDEIHFAKLVNSLDAGLQAPETRNIFSRGEMHRILGSWPMKRRFMLEKLDEEAAKEAQELGPSSPSLSRRTSQRPSRPVSLYSQNSIMTSSSWSFEANGTVIDEYTELDALMLPSSSANDTYDRIASIKISKTEPWSLQEIVSGEQYTAHCLVIQGKLSAFVLTSEERRGSKILHSGVLHDRILDFMHLFTSKLSSNTATHLNIHFVLSETSAGKGIQQSLYPVSADVSANGTLFLHGESASHNSHMTWRLSRLYYAAMPQSHPSALTEGKMGNGTAGDYRRHRVLSVAPSTRGENASDGASRVGLYSLPLSVLHLLVLPLLEMLVLRTRPGEVLRCVTEFLNRVAYEKEEYFDRHDPWPWVWFWWVGFPLQTLGRAGGYIL